MNQTGSELLHTMLLATSALVASTMLTSSGALAGGPTGGKVAVGSATITTPSSTQTVVDQTSQKALINWNSFSVPTGSSITFDQPNTTSLTVNRVLGPNASAIDGQLLANGNIWIINANGILFGHGSQVDVGALLATTSDLSDDDFRKGRYRFTRPGNPGASVTNQGSITAAQGGSVVLSGSQVSNQGIVQANLGTVVLGGANAFTVDLDGDNLLRYQITAPVTAPPKGAPNTGSALVSNSGTIAAAGGRILLTARAAKNVQDDVINNTGQIEATSVSSHDGEVDFDAGSDGTVDVGGTVNASGTGAGQTGGAINVAGGTVNVANGATINASGDAGGGTIQIGGGLHGKGTIANSNATNIGNATISANAITKGNGGTVAIWSNGITSFAGTVSATGGAQGGNGGLVETSGGNVQVGVAGKVITSAAKGATGDWLIDPTNIDIFTGGTDGVGGSNISPTTIVNALDSTNVTLEATNDITINNAVDYSSTNTLSLLASQDIIANAGIQNSAAGAINLIAGWDGETTNLSQLTDPGVYGNNKGSITIGGANASGDVAIGSAGGTTTLAAANLTVEADNGYAQAGYHDAGGGGIVVDTTADVTVDAAAASAQIGNGGTDVSGNVGGDITVNSGGNITIEELANEASTPVMATIGNATGDSTSSQTGEIAVTASGALTVEAQGAFGLAYLGNLSVTDTSGGATGNITVQAGSVSVLESVGSGEAIIGDGGANLIESYNDFTAGGTTGGNIDITAGSVTVTAQSNTTGEGEARIANRATGNASGNYTITTTGDIILDAEDTANSTALVAIGNGENGGTSSGTIDVEAGGNIAITANGATARIANDDAPNSNIRVAAEGNISLSGSEGEALIGNEGFESGADPEGGNITVYSALGAITLTSDSGDVGIGNTLGTPSGNVTVLTASPTNGAIQLTANGDGALAWIGNTSSANASSGNVLVSAGQDVGLSATGTGAVTQIGNGGPGMVGTAGGDITLAVGSDLSLSTGSAGAFAMIGNGDATQSGTGGASGDINLQVEGATALTSESGTPWIGNIAEPGSVESGNVTLISASFQDDGGFGTNVVTDLGSTSQAGSGGDFLFGLTNSDLSVNYNGGDYNSPHNLTIMSVDNVNLDNSIQNSGTGNINIVAGWDGLTASPSQLTNPGVYGNNNGSITIGGEGANGSVAIGSAGGTTTFAAANLTIESDNGYAQAGYHGAGGGDIVVDLTGNLTLNGYGAEGDYAQLGNGSLDGDVSGNVTGNISVNTAGASTINVGEGGGTAWIGNFANENSIESGNVTLITGTADLGNFGANVVADLGSTGHAGSGGDFLLGYTNSDIDIDNSGGHVNSPHNFTILSVDNINLASSIQNSGSGNIDVIAGWDGTTTNLSSLTNSGVYGNNGGTITIGGENANGNVAVGSAHGTTTFAAANLIVESDNGYAQAGYHGAGGGNLVADLTGSLTLNGYGKDGDYAQFGNGSPNGDVSGNITGNISINAAGTTVINVGEGGGNTWIGNFANEGSIESGNVQLITGYVQGDTGPTTLGDMLVADLGTTSVPGSGGNVTLALTNPQTDFINTYLGANSIEYNSPNGLALLSTGNITLPYSIQNDGTGALTILAGWNPLVAPANVLTTPGAYGNTTTDLNSDGGTYTTGAFVWVVGADGEVDDYNPNSSGGTVVDSGAGAAIGSMGGTTTIGAAQIYVEGLAGYAQIGYHNSGGSGAINVIANGVPGTGGLTGVSACFDGDANICVIGGRSNETNPNNYPTYAQIGDLGFGVAGTASSNIDVTATGNIAVAGGGIYDNSDGNDPQIPDAYGMIGNGDGAQTVAQTVGGTIDVNVAGQLNFASSAAAGSEAWLGNRTGAGGLAFGDLTVIMGSENDSGPIDFGDMIFADLGSTSQAGSGGNVTVGETGGSIDIQNDGGHLYNSPNNLTVLSVDDINFGSSIQNSGSGNITAVAGWDGQTISPSQLTNFGVYGNNGGSIAIGGGGATGNVAVGSAGGTTIMLTDTIDVESDNGVAQLGYSGAAAGNINVVALGNVTVDALNGTYAQIGNGGSTVALDVGGDINVTSGGNIVVEANSNGGAAAIGNVSGGSQSGDITVTTTAGGSLAIEALGSYDENFNVANAFIGNASLSDTAGGATGNITIGAGAVSLTASGDASQAFIGDGGFFESNGTTGGNIFVTATSLSLEANGPNEDLSEARIANRGDGPVSGNISVVTASDINIDATDGNLASIGNGESGTGTSNGTIMVQSGGNISITAEDSGQSRIGASIAPDTDIDVTAAGDITLSVTGTPDENGAAGLAFIGSFADGEDAVAGNVTVASTQGSISLAANENNSSVYIGNSSGTSTGGTVTVSAADTFNGAIHLVAGGANSDVYIGNSGAEGPSSGNIIVTAGTGLGLSADGSGSTVQIGNGGLDAQGDDTGNVAITVTTGGIAATLNGDGSFIQLGNGGNGSTGSATGDTSLTAGTSVQLAVGETAADSGSYIQVGDGSAFDATSGGGNIAVNATSMSTSNSVDFVGNSLDIALTGAGNSVGANSELLAIVNDLAIKTNNGSAFVYSPQAVSLGVGEDGIDLGTGGLILAAGGAVTQTQPISAAILGVFATGGAISLTNTNNAITLANLSTSGSDDAALYDTTDLTMTSANVGGDLTLLTEGNLTFAGSASAGGAVLAVAGWDGTTVSPAALTTGTAYGNNGGSITIGGEGAAGNVDVGSASGSTTVAGDNISLSANNGFAQIGYNGAGSGAVDVVASGSVTLTAGTQNDEFAQIGNGGWDTSGDESGNITVDAAGNVALNGGSGQETYAQIGHGGTASNSNSQGYNDTGLITVDGQAVTLAAGSSQGSYAQIGNGGYQSGQNSSGTLTLGGDINVNATSAVSLTGNGEDAYAQIGNGGDFVNSGAANDTTGTTSGNIVVSVIDASNHTSPDPVTVQAGSGADSYAQIGNGGNGENSPAANATVTFNVSGNVTISDLTLIGSDTGQDGYAQVGNGDAAETGTGNISGDITIGQGIVVTIDNGTAPGTDTMIGNDTGFGTVTGTITGYTPASTNPTNTPGGNGAVATTTQTQITPTDTDVNVVTVTPETNDTTTNNQPAPINQPPGPLNQLADNGNSEGTDPSDALTSSLGQSLDARAHNAPITVVKSIIPGVLSEVVMKDPHGPHGIPPADEDYSSWGNEALWQW